jgi:hypothetical protein
MVQVVGTKISGADWGNLKTGYDVSGVAGFGPQGTPQRVWQIAGDEIGM